MNTNFNYFSFVCIHFCNEFWPILIDIKSERWIQERAVIFIITADTMNETYACISLGEKNKRVAIVFLARDYKNSK